MNSFVFFALCIQALLFQTVYSQCSRNRLGLGSVSTISSRVGNFGNSLGFGSINGNNGNYGGVGTGEVMVSGELPAAGTTRVSGQLPILGSVSFNDYVPASGSVTLTGGCGYGCSRSNRL